MAARFPFADRPRLWGVAVSHYQVEGGDPCDWTDWEAAGRTRGEPCGDGVDSWTRYEDDALLAREAGANSFRFSISWSRVEPERGRFDEAALARYRTFVDHLVALGIEPVVTLFHYTHPRWFHEKTPWTSTASVLAFARFAGRVAQALGDGVRFWVILNEPLVFLLAGYLDAQIPPGLADTRTLNRVFDHLLAAHCAAASEIRRHITHRFGLTVTAQNFPAYREEIEREKRRALDRYGMVVIAGFELTQNCVRRNQSAHVLALGVDEFISADGTVEEMLVRAQAASRLVVACHPHEQSDWFSNTFYLWNQRSEVAHLVDLWEIACRWDLFPPIARARMRYIGNSDFHREEHLYAWKTLLPARPNEFAVFRALEQGSGLAVTRLEPPALVGVGA